MTDSPNVTIRTMRPDEIDFAIELAAHEGWNPGLHDAACFAAADPEGFLVAEIEGRPVGCISVVSYEGLFGFLGLYIVIPERRRQGIGTRLWTRGMERLKGHLVGLDGVPAQQDNYRKSGFKLAWQNVRYAGTARRTPSSTTVVPLHDVDFAALSADDRRVFPARRERFLRAWIAMPDATGPKWRLLHASSSPPSWERVLPRLRHYRTPWDMDLHPDSCRRYAEPFLGDPHAEIAVEADRAVDRAKQSRR